MTSQNNRCQAVRQGDEWFCAKCNTRWGVGEDFPYESCGAYASEETPPLANALTAEESEYFDRYSDGWHG